MLLFIGQILFLSLGLTIGIADWGLDGILIIGFGVFGFTIALDLILVLFYAWRYWEFDLEGVTNGNLFSKKKILFNPIEYAEIKAIVIGSKPFISAQENICFYQGKKVVTIPTFCLPREELEWFKQKVAFKHENS
ncbi:MAG: hypothetical protein K6E59_05780 [Bacilli bacterium]|nr:hypothetical protein [Bacilli bacterium]